MITWVEDIKELLPAISYCYTELLKWTLLSDPNRTPAKDLMKMGFCKEDILTLRQASKAEIWLNGSGLVEICRCFNTMGRVPKGGN